MKDCSISFEAFDCNADKFRLVGDTYIVKEIFNRIREQGGYNFFNMGFGSFCIGRGKLRRIAS